MRKYFVCAAIAACLTGSMGTVKAQQSDITLKVGNFGGVFTAAQKKYVGDVFTARTGIKVEYIDANPVAHVAKLIASKGREPPYDVVYVDELAEVQAIAAGVVDKVDPIRSLRQRWRRCSNRVMSGLHRGSTAARGA
jgi:putative spermidine/putrescine transport system substrate-binding protein